MDKKEEEIIDDIQNQKFNLLKFIWTKGKKLYTQILQNDTFRNAMKQTFQYIIIPLAIVMILVAICLEFYININTFNKFYDANGILLKNCLGERKGEELTLNTLSLDDAHTKEQWITSINVDQLKKNYLTLFISKYGWKNITLEKLIHDSEILINNIENDCLCSFEIGISASFVFMKNKNIENDPLHRAGILFFFSPTIIQTKGAEFIVNVQQYDNENKRKMVYYNETKIKYVNISGAVLKNIWLFEKESFCLQYCIECFPTT